MDTAAEVITRSVLEADTDFIYSTWLKNYRFSSAFAEPINDKTYYTFHHKVIERILDRAVDSKVACLAESPDTILGYLVFELWRTSAILHYCYVKFPFRHMGVAKRLLSHVSGSEVQFTHLTDDAQYIRRSFPEMNYNPYLI